MNLKAYKLFQLLLRLLIIIYQYKRVIRFKLCSIHCKTIDLRNLFNKFKNIPLIVCFKPAVVTKYRVIQIDK